MIPVEAWRSSTARNGAGTDTRPLRSILFANVDRKTATSTSARASTKSLREYRLEPAPPYQFSCVFKALPPDRAAETRIGTPSTNHGTLWRVHGTIWVSNGNLCVFLGFGGFHAVQKRFELRSARIGSRSSSRILFLICSHFKVRSYGTKRLPFRSREAFPV